MAEILIVDDDPGVVELLSMYLRKSEFSVRSAESGPACLDAIDKRRPDLILLDIMLPGMDGYEVLQTLKDKHSIPTIFVSARDDEVDPILGLEFGADDYITKPFNPREVVARVKAVLRRSAAAAETGTRPLRYPGFELDPDTREVRVKGTEVALTPREFDIVALIAGRPRHVFSRPEILQTIWGYDSDYGDYRTVDTHMKRARQKLTQAGMATCVIETVWGTGYRFVVREPEGHPDA